MKAEGIVLVWQRVKSFLLVVITLIVFYGVLLFAFPGWSGSDLRSEIRVVLRPEVVVKEDWIRLGDIAEVSDASLEDLVIMPAPEAGDLLRVDSGDLKQILAQRGIFAEVVGKSLVSRKENLVPSEQLRKELSEILERAGYELDQAVLPNVVGKGKIEISYPSMCGGRCYVRVKVGDHNLFVRVRPRVKGKAWRVKRDLLPGEVVGEEDVELVNCLNFKEDLFPFNTSPVGWTVRRVVRKGEFLLRGEVSRRYVIRRGDKVEIFVQGGGILVKALGVSLESGAPGDVIRVKNVDSGRIILGKVIGPNRVEVDL